MLSLPKEKKGEKKKKKLAAGVFHRTKACSPSAVKMEISLALRARAPASGRGGISFSFFHISAVSSVLFRLHRELFRGEKLNGFTFFLLVCRGIGRCFRLNWRGRDSGFPVTEKKCQY